MENTIADRVFVDLFRYDERALSESKKISDTKKNAQCGHFWRFFLKNRWENETIMCNVVRTNYCSQLFSYTFFRLRSFRATFGDKPGRADQSHIRRLSESEVVKKINGSKDRSSITRTSSDLSGKITFSLRRTVSPNAAKDFFELWPFLAMLRRGKKAYRKFPIGHLLLVTLNVGRW